MSCKMHCVLEDRVNSKSCTWDSFCSFVEIWSPCAHYLGGVHSCAKPTVLWCNSGLCPHTWHTSSPVQSHPWFNECPPQTGKKIKKLIVMHSTWQIFAPPSELVPHSHKCPMFPSPLPGALRNIRHLHELSTSSEGGGRRSLWNKVL